MELCLEEVLSNIIRHGCSNQPDQSIAIQFCSPRENYFVLVVEDEGPPFNPVDAPELPAFNPHADPQIAGQGIHLLRQLADALEYQPTP